MQGDGRYVGGEARRYGAAARQRLTRAGHGEQSGDRCVICGGPRSAYEFVSFIDVPKLVRSVSVCSGCGYVSIAELTQDRYRGKGQRGRPSQRRDPDRD